MLLAISASSVVALVYSKFNVSSKVMYFSRCGVQAAQSIKYITFALLAVVCVLLMPSAMAATSGIQFAEHGDEVTNKATLMFHGGELTSETTIKVVLKPATEPTPSTIEFLHYQSPTNDPNASDPNTYYDIITSEYSASGEVVGPYLSYLLALPAGSRAVGEDKLTFPANLGLQQTSSYATNDPVFIRVTDRDQNRNDQLRERIVVTLGTDTGADTEVIVLVESDVNSGIFIGYIATLNTSASEHDGVLSVLANSKITARYVDRFDQTDVSATAALVDPYGIIFNSETGEGVNDVDITVINVATGQAAEVFAPDGITQYPSTVRTGSVVTDAGGNRYQLAQGQFYFPLMKPGDYRFEIINPEGYLANASSKTNAELRQLPNGDQFSLTRGSRLEVFTVEPGPALEIDIPIDPEPAQPFVIKRANKGNAAIGDFVQFTIDVSNPSVVTAVPADTLIDVLPKGFRYVSGSLSVNGETAQAPRLSDDGVTMNISVPRLAPEESISIRYVTQIGADAELGQAVNTAYLLSQHAQGLLAKAKVTISEDLFSSKAIVMGRVIWDNCQAESSVPVDEQSVPGVRIYMQDGTFVTTDSNGMWHIEGVKPGLHVVQVDLDSLPEHLEVVECQPSPRRAGTPYSEFVDVQGGTLWRTNFHLRQKVSTLGEISIEQSIRASKTLGVELAVHFAHDSAVVDSVYLDEIKQLADFLQQNPETRVTIEGHTSVVGTVAYNHKLSQRRANAIASILTQQFAIDRGRVSAVGYGELKPLNFANDERAHAQNRRIIAQIEFLAGITDTPRKLDVTLNIRNQLSQYNRLQLDNYQIRYQVPNGWQLATGSGKVNKRTTAPQQLANNTLTWSLDKLSREQVHFSLVPTVAQIADYDLKNVDDSQRQHSTFDFSGVGIARIAYQNLASRNPEQIQSGAESRVSLQTLLQTAVNNTQEIQATSAAVKAYQQRQQQLQTSAVATKTSQGFAPVDTQLATEEAKEKKAEPGILSMQEGALVSRPTISLRFALDSRLQPKLSLNNELITEDRQAFKATDTDSGLTTYNYIGIDVKEPGAHQFVLQGIGPFGNARFEQTVNFVRTGEVQKVRLLNANGNVADGKSPIKIQLGLLDVDGNHIPAEVKLSIQNSQLSPYQSEYDRAVLQTPSEQLTMKPDGTVLFNPVTQAGMYSAEIIYDENVSEKIKFYVKPYLRDWIFVGFARGSAGYNDLSGNMQALDDADIDGDFYQDGEVKFYAKGKVRGDWLLTMAYDSKKRKDEERLNQTITPGAYYTLYGDAATQEHDAASREKLYLRLETDQFYALFGDFNTGLGQGEITAYNRSLTGVKAEYTGEQFNITAFAAETDQLFIRDDIQGEGVSGLYYLSNQNIAPNTESISIEVRDRFDPLQVIEQKSLTRFVDYSIDYSDGSLFFKRPINSVDRSNNPIFIVAEYEMQQAIGTEEVIAGGRIGVKLPGVTEQGGGELGVSHIDEGQSSRQGTLTGVDITYNVNDELRITAEAATTDSIVDGEQYKGDAYRVELEHQGKALDGKIYVNEEQAGFGLGQQSENSQGLRSVGTEGRYRFSEDLQLTAELSQQTDLQSQRKRDLAEARLELNQKSDNYYVGLRTVKESGGERRESQQSDQVLIGARQSLFDSRLVLTADYEQTLADDETIDFPSRLNLGADYDITDWITLNADQEFSFGDKGSEQASLLGLSARPYTGMSIGTNIEQKHSENGDRLFANYGLMQTVKLNDFWDINIGLDRAQLLKDEQGTTTPEEQQQATDFARDSVNSEDFTALSTGANYSKDAWAWDSLFEYRTSDSDDKYNLLSSVVHDLQDGIVMAGKVEVLSVQSNIDENDSLSSLISFGLAYRPMASRWIVLDKLEFKYDEQHSEFNQLRSRRFINNINANYLWDHKTQVALQYSFKYVLETIDENDYAGFTDLVGAEVRHNLSQTWDVGLHANVLHSWEAENYQYGYGGSIGYSPERNVWISFGYNLQGFKDRDFNGSEYTAQGPFLRFRIKADQNTFKSIFED
ncbi:OmpA family protein [Thalassotalea maritima]|uniref:OmpA family protein n=1 Tax=Thalassotalea maritima TaxID=3242416 RepID=UPI0035274D2E